MLRQAILVTAFLLLQVSAFGAISTYKDRDFTRPATEFGDGDKAYFTVTEPGITGGTRTVTVTSNGSSLQSVTVSAYDHGLYYDKTADDGVFSGMFIVTTKLTIDPTNIESTESPAGLCYKIVPNIHVDNGGIARISDGGVQDVSLKLLTLFNVEARAIADTSVVIFWNTSDSGYSRVEYGFTVAYGNSAVRETPVRDLALSHYVTLSGLTPGTLYHYKVSSIDTYGNSHVSGDYTFTTKASAEVEAAIRAARKDRGLPKTYYVKTDGNDADDGLTIATAWKHPSVAVSTAQAGDTICLMEGIWTDEHLVFGSSGIDIAPITLMTYGDGMAVLDGGDRTGIGIRTLNKSYITISGIRLRNYYQGMSFENGTSNIRVSHFMVESTQRNGIQFIGSNPVSSISFSDFEISATGLDTYAAISYGDGTDFKNIEIINFYIHDTYGSGIYWRFVDRLHVNDGRVLNEPGSDGICFSLGTYNSVMENIAISNAQTHGVAVHDWTLGNNPCFNNTIRNCDISNCGHNHIDLHSGAFNTLVEKNTLHEELAFCTGVYFHNRGAGLIARDNHIYNVSRGFSGLGFDEYPLTDMIIENNNVHDCYAHNFDMFGYNMKIKGNILRGEPGTYSFALAYDTITIENNDADDDKTYRIEYGQNNRIRDPKDSSFSIQSAHGASISLEYTDNSVFKQSVVWGGNLLSSPLFLPNGSCTVINSSVTAQITVYPMTARPESSTGTVTVSTFNATLPIGQYQTVFQASVADNASAMDFTVKSLVPWAWYEVQKDSVTFAAARQLDAAGSLSFRNDRWTGTHRFGIKQVPDTAAPVISGVTIISVVAAGIRVRWTTNEPADSRIEYGETAEYGSTTAADTQLVLAHSQDIAGLAPGWYHFRVISRDASGNEAMNGDYTVFVSGGDRPVVVPNPYIRGKSRGSKVVFESLPAGAVVRIYALSGEPVTTIVHNATSGGMNEEWNVSDVAGGIYLYTITAGGSTTRGKLGVIK